MLQAYQFECKVCHNRSPVDSALLQVPVLPGPGDTAYAFTCGSCATPAQAMSFKHTKKSWLQIASTTLYNLQRTEKRKFFNLKEEVFQYVENHWEDLCNGRQETTNWQELLEGELKTHSAYFEPSPTLSGYWALRPSASTSLPGFIAKTTAKRTKLRTSGRGRSPSPISEVESADVEMEDMETDLSAEVESKSGGSDTAKSDQHEPMSDNEDEDGFHADDDYLFDAKRKNRSELSSSSGSLSQSGSDGKRKKDKKNELSCSQDKGSPMWCHQCKQKHNEVVYCSRTCSKKYCNRCVWRHYREKVDQIDQAQWVCYYCRGVCSCAFCRRRRAKETNTKFESHRGKKRRITVDSHAIDDGVKKKRKLKASVESKFVVDEDYVDEEFEDEDVPLTAEAEEAEYPQHTASVVPEGAPLAPSSPKQSLPPTDHGDELAEFDEDEEDRSPRSSHQRGDSRRSRDKRDTRDTTQFDDRSRVTLKDLIDSGVLQAGDSLVFRQSEQSAVLLADGTILWMDTVFSSLSTFAKQVAHKLGQWTNGAAFHNGWRVINCRGKVMDYYRKQYRKLIESQQSSANSTPAPVFKSEPIKFTAVAKEFAEPTQPAHVTYDMDSDMDDDEEDPEPSIRDSFESIAVARNSGPLASDQIRLKLETTSTNKNESSEEDQWWLNHDEDHDLVYASPLSYSHEFLLPSSPHQFVHVDEPRDILAIDHAYDQFLDIRDKDFFNVASGILDAISRPSGTSSSHLISPLSTHVDVSRSDDLYSWGMDSSISDFI